MPNSIPNNDIEEDKEIVPIKRSRGTYQKEIVPSTKRTPKPEDSIMFRTNYGGYYFYEIEVNKKAYFSLKVFKASNEEATRDNVYWVAQDYKDFGTRNFLEFKGTENKLQLHEFLNSLNEGTAYGPPFLKDGKPNPRFDETKFSLHTLKTTNYVGLKYRATNPYLDNDTKRVLENDILLGNLVYKTDKIGHGIWIEGVNFSAEFLSQGAFIVAVGEPEITSFFAEKRVMKEAEVDAKGVKKENCDQVEGELIYGDVMDLHICLHNVFDYVADLEIFCGDKSMDVNSEGENYVKVISLLDQYKIENPSLYYNLEIIDELIADFRWANKSNHAVGENNQDSLQEYKMKLKLTPVNSNRERRDMAGVVYKSHDTRKVLTREISFTVNYKENFSPDEHEPQYLTNIVKVKQPPVVSQSYEMCKYTEIKITLQGEPNPQYLLQESNSGALTDNKTPYYQFVAGNNKNTKEIIIDVSSGGEDFTGVDECVNEYSHKDHDTHPNNVFNTASVKIYDYKKDYEDTIWGKIKKIANTKNNIFGNVQPYSNETRTKDQLKFTIAYPYNSYSNTTFLLRYLTFQLKPEPLDISIQSCRYVRTPKFLVHPDVKWAMHLNYDVVEAERLYFQGENIKLVEGHGTYMSYIGEGVDWINKKVKPFIEEFVIKNNAEAKKSWKVVQDIINDFVEDSNTIIAVGFHAVYDGEEVINYADIQPYKAILHYQIFKVALLTLVLDLLMIYLTRGKVSPGMAKFAKVARKIEKAQKQLNNFKDKYDLSFQMPKITMNAGIYKEQQDFGRIAIIFEYNLKADPFLGIDTEYKFAPEQLPSALKKFELIAKLEGVVKFDINIKYNTLTREFSLTNNAKQQKGGGENVFKNGDIVQMEGLVGMEIEAEGKLEKEFKSKWKFLPIVKTTIHGKIKLQTAAGITRKLGVDNVRGPFMEDTLFFDGLKGEYFQKVVVKVVDSDRDLYNSNPSSETKNIPKFGYVTASLGRAYLFEMFSFAKK